MLNAFRDGSRLFCCHAVLALLLPFGFAACPERTTNVSSSTPNVASTATSIPAPSAASPTVAAFDGDKAFAHVREMVAMGARPAGSPELARTRDYIIRELTSYGLKITTDEFAPRTPQGLRRMVNVTAELPGASNDFVIVASHYDTKFYKDMRFVGANDGGSSTAVVMEIARVLAANAHAGRKLPLTYRFVLFDGEEAFCDEWSECTTPDGKPDNTYGSRRYVSELTNNGELARVRALVLLDLVGYRDLKFERDTYSTAWLTNTIWETARELGYGNIFVSTEAGVEDDHIAFLRAGVNAVDIIQLGTYPYWHKAEDTLDKISPKSLKITGDVVLASLPKIEARLATGDATKQ
jgi:hypothetical protein